MSTGLLPIQKYKIRKAMVKVPGTPEYEYKNAQELKTVYIMDS